MRRITIFVLFVVAVLSIAGCGQGGVGDQVLARVGSREVTVAEFHAAMARQGVDPRVFNVPEARRELLNELVRIELMAEGAERAGLFDEPDVRRAVELFAANRLQMQLLAAASNEVRVTDEEVSAFYAKHAEEFVVPERAHVAVLQIAVPRAAPEAKKRELLAKANKVRQEAAALPATTPNFGPLSVKYSDDVDTRYTGGDAGWLTRKSERGRWDAEVVKVAFMLKNPGELSPVISSDNAFYILKLIEHRASSRIPLTQVGASLRRKMEDQRRREVIDRYIADLQKDVSVKIDEKVFAGMGGGK